MSAFDLTDADAQGLDALAAAQLRLALRFAERAEAAEDDDAACKLARTSERAARSYRQILLVKSKLKRERDTALRDAATNPVPPTPQEQARTNKRQRDLYEAVESIVCETLEQDWDIRITLGMAFDAVAEMAKEPGFADAALDEPASSPTSPTATRICTMRPASSAATPSPPQSPGPPTPPRPLGLPRLLRTIAEPPTPQGPGPSRSPRHAPSPPASHPPQFPVIPAP